VKDVIREKARELGFDSCHFGPAGPLTERTGYYSRFLEEGRFASLSYLRRYAEQKIDPGKAVPEVKSAIALLLNYYPPEIIPEEDNFVIAKYAYGSDYHLVMRDRLTALAGFIKNETGSRVTRPFIDSGPLLEKSLAMRSGAGWIGKNTLLLNRTGSFFFIGILLTDLEIEPDEPGADHCGSCTLCMDACPTGALQKPYQLDIARCISYLTIESKETVAEEQFPRLRDRIYGCDICQDVCPYNRKPVITAIPGFKASEKLLSMRKKEWLALDEAGFDELFRDTPVHRTGFRKIRSTMEGIERTTIPPSGTREK
jgi:epoxyqueuosine reductase